MTAQRGKMVMRRSQRLLYNTKSVPGVAVSCGGNMNAKILQEADDVTAPAGGHGGRAECVFKNQIPADDPGEDLTERRIAIGVSRACDRNQRRELRVAEARQRRSQMPAR